MTGDGTFLFASDLDGTLLPNGGKVAAPGCLERTRELLSTLRTAGCPVCFVTGRHLSLAREGADGFGLSPPDWWACNVGSEIYNGEGERDAEWVRSLGPELDREALRRALQGIPGLTLQEAQKQGPHKFSCYYPEAATARLRADILERAAGVQAGLQLIASVEESTGRALLDLLPATAGKARSLEFLARRHYGLSLTRVFFAGDSGNDIDVLLSGPCATLMGNVPTELREHIRRIAAGRPEARLYLAESYYGDGIIEGLRHYGLWPLTSASS